MAARREETGLPLVTSERVTTGTFLQQAFYVLAVGGVTRQPPATPTLDQICPFSAFVSSGVQTHRSTKRKTKQLTGFWTVFD